MGPFKDGWDEAQVEAVLARGDPDELLYVPIVVSLDPPDCDWARAICERLISNADPRVRGNAALGFGHLARVCRSLAPHVAPLVEAALSDPVQEVRGKANDAAHDINHFLGWSLKTLD